MAALFSSLALLCAIDAVLVAALAGRSQVELRSARGCGWICGAILTCGAVCLVAACVAR